MAGRRGQYPPELRERAVRLVAECRADHGSEWEAMRSVAQKLGIGTTETVRKWVRRAEVDAGARPGVTSEESAELRRLKAEVKELRRADESRQAAAGFLSAPRLPPPPDSWGWGAGTAAELRRLKAEVKELRRANEILKAAAGFFAAELDRPPRIS